MDRPQKPNYLHLALGAWVILALVVSIRAFISPENHTVYPVYMRAAANWIAGRDLYAGAIDFRYSPPVAASFVPLSLLPLRLGAALWRLINVLSLLGALLWWMRTPALKTLTSFQKALLLILVLPLAANSINNGQINSLLTALLVAATAAVSEELAIPAAICLTLAILLKIYPITLALLFLLCYPRRLLLPMLLIFTAAVGLSLLLRDPPYVIARYAEWFHAIRTDDRDLARINLAPTDVRLLIRLWWDVPPRWAYQALQAATAIGLALLCFRNSRQPQSKNALPAIILGLASCWMLLFGPATEANTFVLVAPAAAFLSIAPADTPRARKAWLLAVVGYWILIASQIVGWFPFGRDVQSAGVAPLGTLLVFAAFILFSLQTTPAPQPSNLLEPLPA